MKLNALYALILSTILVFLQSGWASQEPSSHAFVDQDHCGPFLEFVSPAPTVDFGQRVLLEQASETLQDVSDFLRQNYAYGLPVPNKLGTFKLIVVGPGMPFKKVLAKFKVEHLSSGVQIHVQEVGLIDEDDCNRFWRGLAFYKSFPGYTFKYPAARPLRLNTGGLVNEVTVSPGVMIKLFLARGLDQRQVRALMRQVRSVNFYDGNYEQVLQLPGQNYRLVYVMRSGHMNLKTIYRQ